MSNRQAQVDLDWGDGTHTFRLTVVGAIELEQKCDAPFAVVFKRLVMTGDYSITDVRETLRLGLIGGGKPPVDALKLVRQYVDERPLAENLPTAKAVISGLMFGFAIDPLSDIEAEQPGKPEAAPTTDPSVSTPPASTEQRRSSESPLKPLVRSRFGNGQQS